MTKKFRCMVCGYIHEGAEAPQECPVCHVGAEKFEEIVATGDAQAQADLAGVYMFIGNSLSQADPDEDYAIALEY